jgi:hypothetical protein
MNIESAINIIIDSSKKYALAGESGDYKTVNKNYDLIRNSINFLREHDGLPQLKQLLEYNDISVRIVAASFLLKHFESDAILVLKEIVSKSIPIQSFEAKMILQQWQKVNLNL